MATSDRPAGRQSDLPPSATVPIPDRLESSAAPPARRSGSRLFSQMPAVLRHNALYRRYWISQLVSLAGTWMQQVASSLVVLTLTTSAFTIGLVTVVGSLPMLFLSLSGGVIADRYDKRIILLVTQWILCIFALAYAVLIWSDRIQLWHLFAISVLWGIVIAYEMPASQAFTPELVSREELPEAIALNGAAFNGSRLLGPGLAGALVSILGLASAFVANGLSFLAVIVALMRLKGRPVRASTMGAKGSGALREGLTFVAGQPVMLGLILMVGATSLLVFPNLAVLMPLYVIEVLDAGDAWVGAMMSVSGGGSFVGSLAILKGERTTAAAKRRLRISVIGVTLGLLGLALVRSPWLAVAPVLLLSFCISLGMAQATTSVQQLAPDDLRGRVMSIHGLAFTGVMPFAVLLVSAMANLFGQPVTLVISALGFCAIVSWSQWAYLRPWNTEPEPPVVVAAP